MSTYPPITLPGTEVRLIHSNHVDQDYQLFVYLPWGYADSDETYPVLYFTDANFFYFRYLWSSFLPPMIAVGIGYDTADYAEQVRLRSRDFLPTKDVEAEKRAEEYSHFKHDSGGGERFLAFIREELFRFIDEEYRTKPEDRVYFGHSSGGTFGVYTLFNQPDTFNRYILASPSLGWDNRVCFAYEQAYAEKHTKLPVKLYLAAGVLENSSLVATLVEFHGIVKGRKYEGLEMKLDLFKDETHMSVVNPAMHWGVRTVFNIDLS